VTVLGPLLWLFLGHALAGDVYARSVGGWRAGGGVCDTACEDLLASDLARALERRKGKARHRETGGLRGLLLLEEGVPRLLPAVTTADVHVMLLSEPVELVLYVPPANARWSQAATWPTDTEPVPLHAGSPVVVGGTLPPHDALCEVTRAELADVHRGGSPAGQRWFVTLGACDRVTDGPSLVASMRARLPADRSSEDPTE